MKILVLRDKDISSEQLEFVTTDLSQFYKTYLEIEPTWHFESRDYTNYPTHVDEDADIRPTDAWLRTSMQDVYSRWAENIDHVIILIHEDNWKSAPANGRKIWGTNYSNIYSGYQVHYCRWDKDNLANSVGTMYHEMHHSFDALCATYANVDIRPLIDVTNWDRSVTHGGKKPWRYIRHKENEKALQQIKEPMAIAYKQRDLIHKKKTLIALLQRLVVLLRAKLNQKNGVSKQYAPTIMPTISKNGAGLAILLVTLFAFVGVDLDLDTATGIIEAVALVASTVLMIWNQVTRSDVTNFFFKK